MCVPPMLYIMNIMIHNFMPILSYLVCFIKSQIAKSDVTQQIILLHVCEKYFANIIKRIVIQERIYYPYAYSDTSEKLRNYTLKTK